MHNCSVSLTWSSYMVAHFMKKNTKSADNWISGTSRVGNIAKELPMNLQAWDGTINQIADESNQQPEEAGKQRVLFAWRAKLAKEPTSLPPFRIDEIVREVRKKLVPVSH